MKEPTLSEIYRLLTSHVNESKEDRDSMKEDLTSIKEQTIKTNGRVNQLEKDSANYNLHIDSLRLWRNLLIGGGIVISGIGIATITLFLTTYKKNLIYETSEQVVTALEEKYNIIIK